MPLQRRLDWSAALRGMHADRIVSPEQRRAANTASIAIKLATESAKRFTVTVAPLVRRDGTLDRSAIMRAATRSAQARIEPLWVSRRPFGLSQAAKVCTSVWA